MTLARSLPPNPSDAQSSRVISRRQRRPCRRGSWTWSHRRGGEVL